MVGLFTLLFLLCHGRTSFRRSSTRRSGDFSRPKVIALLPGGDSVRNFTGLEAERKWTASLLCVLILFFPVTGFGPSQQTAQGLLVCSVSAVAHVVD